MKNKINLITLIFFTFISFSTFASANFEITPDIDTLVPENTLMYFQISNPEELMTSIDNLLFKTGMNELLGNMSIIDFITLQLESEDYGISIDYFNLNHPVGFAILPPSKKFAEKNDVEYMVFIPINTSMDILKLITTKQGNDNSFYKIYMNYLVYFSSEELEKNFPAKKIVNLSNFDKYS
ncbi:MAG: hypothetical protein PF693_20670, partial [Spirochaetia bacterium]|nr:hypothetical protein [Spirochaetia bacterium]